MKKQLTSTQIQKTSRIQIYLLRQEKRKKKLEQSSSH